MPATRSWTFPHLAPAESDKVGLGDDEFRFFRDDNTERSREGGVEWGTSVTTDGRHCVGIGNGPDIYKADKATKLVTYADTGATMVAGSSWSGGNVTTGNNPGHGHTGTIVVRVSGTVSTGQIRVAVRVPRPITFVRAAVVVFTTPGVGGLRVDIKKLVAPINTTNRLAAGASIFALDADKPQIVAGEFGGSTTTFGTTTAAAGDEILFYVDLANSAADLTISFEVTKA